MTTLRIGTRGSKLALWQARHVADLLLPWLDGRPVELVEIRTLGDRSAAALAEIGGEGVFTKEIQNALLSGRVDVAVHSLKDLPTAAVEGLRLAAVPPRGPAEDVLISARHVSLTALPPGAVAATGSVRRQAFLRHRRPDLRVVPLRGNVETRLDKLADPGLDAVVLARAGLERLGLEGRITEVLDTCWMLPAVGQGAIGVECRGDDTDALRLLARINHEPSRLAVEAERALLHHLGGGCQLPVGALAWTEGDELHLRAAAARPDGGGRIDAATRGPRSAAEDLGRGLAEDLLGRGARELLGGA